MTDTKLKRQLAVYAQLFFGMALFGTGTPAAKVVADAFPMFLGPFLRLLVASLALTPFLIMHRKRLPEISKRDWVEIAIIGGVGIVAFTIFLLKGMHRVNGVVGSVVMSLSPAAMALAAVLFMHDRMGWRKFLAHNLGCKRGTGHQCHREIYSVLWLELDDRESDGIRGCGQSNLVFAVGQTGDE